MPTTNMSHISFVHSSVSGLLAHFHVLVNITLMDLGVLKSLQGLNFISFHNYQIAWGFHVQNLQGISFCSLCAFLAR